MNILAIGDVVGSAGCKFLRSHLPSLKKLRHIDPGHRQRGKFRRRQRDYPRVRPIPVRQRGRRDYRGQPQLPPPGNLRSVRRGGNPAAPCQLPARRAGKGGLHCGSRPDPNRGDQPDGGRVPGKPGLPLRRGGSPAGGDAAHHRAGFPRRSHRRKRGPRAGIWTGGFPRCSAPTRMVQTADETILPGGTGFHHRSGYDRPHRFRAGCKNRSW